MAGSELRANKQCMTFVSNAQIILPNHYLRQQQTYIIADTEHQVLLLNIMFSTIFMGISHFKLRYVKCRMLFLVTEFLVDGQQCFFLFFFFLPCHALSDSFAIFLNMLGISVAI